MIWAIVGGVMLFVTALVWAMVIAASDADRQSAACAGRICDGE